jgi:cyclophilin family peptidyl-prolyl cis-trans isomerase
MPRPLVPIVIAAALAGGGCGSSKSPGHAASGAAAVPRDAAGCRKVAAPRPKDVGRLHTPALRLSPATAYTVTLETNCGAIVIRLDAKRAPKTAASFAALARRGFYAGLTFHRIVAGFVIQGGDPSGTGQGGPGYTVVERPPRALRYTRGVVAMAKTGSEPAGASGSQFFIVTAPNAGLTPLYALVGRVTSGMAAVDRIAAEPVDAQSFPQSPVVIEKATVSPAP